MAGLAASGRGHGVLPEGVADAGAFLVRLTRLDPAALVRLRPAGAGRTALWARLPWEVLATRSVPGERSGDVTVRAADLLAELSRGGAALPAPHDQQWRWPLPARRGEVVERIPAGTVRGIGVAAEGTLRAAARTGVGGRPVGDRAVRDALLDHVAIVVTGDPAGSRLEVPQRLVQAVVRMGFLGAAAAGGGPGGEVRVLRAGRWVGLAAAYGTAWLRPADSLTVSTSSGHPIV